MTKHRAAAAWKSGLKKGIRRMKQFGMLSRRSVLAGAAAVAALGRSSLAEAEPKDAAFFENYLKLHSRSDEKPAFWFERGQEYKILNGSYTVITDRTVMVASRARHLGGGAFALENAETVVSIERGPDAKTQGPSTRGPFPWTVDLDAQGKLSYSFVNPDGMHVTYTGSVSKADAFPGTQWFHQNYEVESITASGERETLIELFLIKETPYGEKTAAYLPADNTVTVTRAQLVKNAAENNKAGYLIAEYHGRKYPTMDAMVKDLFPEERKSHQPLIENWRYVLK